MIMAMIRPETEMKNSGVQWLGNIPKEWSVGKVKHEFYATKTIVGDKVNDYERLALTLNGVIKRSKDAGDGLQPEKFDGYQILKEHELVFKLIDLANVSTSRVGLSPYTGIVSPAYIVLHHRKDMNPRYGEYYFLSMWMNEVFNHIGGDGVRSALNAKDLLNIPYLKVSPDEQQAIADYLDETCSKIDEIIAEAKASIDEYKELKQSVIFEAVTKGLDKNVEMKDSGVEWIGEIPVDWNIAKINRVAWTTSGATPLRSKETEYYDNAVIRWVRTLDLNNGHVTDSSEKITETALKNSSCSIMPVKTVCVAMYGGSGTIGKSGILEVECATNQAICSIVSDKKVLNPDYLHYVIMAVRKYWMKYAVGTRKDPNINQQIIAQMRIPIPQLSKQDIIVNHLDKVTDKCDSLIAEKESLINDLEAYKKSLIYEVVTGKRRVV